MPEPWAGNRRRVYPNLYVARESEVGGNEDAPRTKRMKFSSDLSALRRQMERTTLPDQCLHSAEADVRPQGGSPSLALLGHPGISAFGSLLGHKRTSSALADSLRL
jgi:hypothetical protein